MHAGVCLCISVKYKIWDMERERYELGIDVIVVECCKVIRSGLL